MAFPFANPFGRPSVATGHNIARSLRCNSADSAYLSRTFGSAGNRRTFTWSGWVKRGKLGTTQRLFTASDGSASTDADYNSFFFNSSNQLQFGGNSTTFRITSAVYRDPAAHMHVMLAVDTTQATAANRIKLYVNGAEVTAFGTNANPSQNFDLAICNNIFHYIGRVDSAADYFDGLLSEIHFVDGQALTPATFGETSATTGQWVPKQVTGLAYGTNGFYLSFANNASATTLGYDDAGGAAGSGAGSNDWTLNNFSVTAGVGNDSLTDTPTNNHCTLNPLRSYGSNAALANGALQSSVSSTSNDRGWFSTMSLRSGLWYAEFTFTATNGDNNGGVGVGYTTGTAAPGDHADTVSWRDFGTLRQNAAGTSYGSALAANDVVMLAIDANNNRVWFGKNGTWFGSGNPATGTNPSATGICNPCCPATYHYSTAATIYANFGQRAFAHTPPTGFQAMCAGSLSTPTIPLPSQHFDAKAYIGTGANQDITNYGFQPDFVWLKSRGVSRVHGQWDSTRGATKYLTSGTTAAEVTDTSNGLIAFLPNGFRVGATGTWNTSAESLMSWGWKRGVTAGFDIVSYTGDNTSNRNISHGLGVAPGFAIVKRTDSTSNWWTWHQRFSGNTTFQPLNGSGGVGAATTTNTPWGTGNWSASQFMVTNNATENANASSGAYIAYLFAEVDGFSRFGSYTGNNSSDGPHVWCGFRPRFVLLKNVNAASQWRLYDATRDAYNVVGNSFRANDTQAEASAAALDFLANGFKIRTTGTDHNDSGNMFIFAAFSEFPFKYSNAR